MSVDLLNPKNAKAFIISGILKFYIKDFKGAILDHNKGIELKPNFADAYISRGFAKSELKDFKGAIADFNKAIELKPNLKKFSLFEGDYEKFIMNLLNKK